MEKDEQQKKNIFVEMENEVLAFWEANKIFEKSVVKEAPKGEYVFYDGPPFATGTPHYGHLVASLMKDAVPRFWTMNGYQVQRKWGWDCHGLPIENIVEKELGTKSKKEIIENIGVEKFNALCRSKVLSYADEWKKIITRLGRWADMEHPYRTMDIGYMESIWWAFKQLWSNDLIYKDYRSMHICPRCETTLSQSEVAEGYKDVKDLSVTAKFELVDEPGTFVLAWTTTPWTLPGNVALAVGNDVDYVLIEIVESKNDNIKKGEKFIVSKNLLQGKGLHPGGYEDGSVSEKTEYSFHCVNDSDIFNSLTIYILKEFKGAELIGKKYKPLFDYYANDEKLANRENGWQIYHGDFVTTEDGTGVVHIAPAFGEDDMNLGRQYNLPFVQHVAMDGTFNKEMGEFAGMHVKPKDNVISTDLEILKYLQKNNLFFSKENYLHSYPHCWRCETPLINYATSSWFVKINEMKPRMLELAEGINWSPEHIKSGRFGKWLEGARDWSISRQRFWASCMPIWECACGAKKVMGSLEEFYQAANGQITKLILVRHGEARCNAAGIITALLEDNHLTEKGKEQVAAAIEKLKKEIAGQEKNIVAYASPVTRTKETAALIGESLGFDFESADELREISLGSWENKDRKELAAHDELRQKYLIATPEEVMDFRCGGTGETQTEVGERVYQWLLKTLEKNKGKIILIVSHSDPIDDLISILRGRTKRESGLSLSGPDHTHKAEFRIVYVDNTTKKEIDLHKDSVDKIDLQCDVCGGEMKRVSDVLDTWFDSGSMPYAQMHYPFENKERFENNFPAEFIAEGVDQTRCWFYYLHAIAAGVKNNFAYKNVIVNGIVLAEDGKKMSKRLQNYPDPGLLFEKHGADALRYYLLTSPVMTAENLNFSEKGVADCLRKVNMILWNVYKFYEMYANVLPLNKGESEGVVTNSENILDKWILARLNQLVAEVTDGMNKYDLPSATRPIVSFIDDFSTWYLRRSRDRFKDEGEDKDSALATMKFVLIDLAKVMAPFTPFIAEQLWQKVTGNNFANPEKSVHLEEFPSTVSFRRTPESSSGTEDVLADMEKIRKIVELGLAKRDEAGIKVRQPLNKLSIINYQLSIEYEELIKDELNVKSVICPSSVSFPRKRESSNLEIVVADEIKVGENISVELDVTMTPELIAEGLKRELVRFINAERKNANLTIGDKIILHIATASEAVKNAVKLFEADLKKDVLADEIIIGALEGGKEVEANGEKLIIKVEKI